MTPLRTAVERWVPSPERYWWGYVCLVGVLAHGVGVWRVVSRLRPGTRPNLVDSIIFEYIGWYLTAGGRLYVDVYDIKPPLSYELPAALALLAGGRVWWYHWLAVVATIAAAVVAALAVGALVRVATGDGRAAAVAGVAVYAFPAYHWRTAFGFKPKYFVACCGLLGLYASLRARHATAGGLAAASAGFWQFGAVFPGLLVGHYVRAGDRAALGRTLAGIAAVAAAVLAPVLAWDAVGAMLVETVIVPVVLAGTGHPPRLGFLWSQLLGAAFPVAVAGGLGVVLRGWRVDAPLGWWLPTLAAWFGVQALVLDLDGMPDVFPLWTVIAVGAGLAAARWDARIAAVGRGWPLVVAVGLVGVAVVTLGGLGGVALPVPNPVLPPGTRPTAPYWFRDHVALFWGQYPPETCRVFYGPSHRRWVELVDGDRLAERCGRLDPALRALRRRFGA